MFELINSIRSDLTHSSMLALPGNMNDRLEIVKDVVNRLYRSAIPDCNNQDIVSTISLKNYFSYGSMNALPQKITISPIWLIDSQEIPEQFRFSDINDPRLNDSALLEQYSDWLCDKMSMPRHDCIDKEMIQGNLLFMQDRQKAKEACKFLLMHELGHIHNRDRMVNLIQWGSSLVISLSWPIGVAIALGWPMMPFVIIAAATSFTFLRVIGILLHRNRESNADAFAAKHCPDAIDGGIHFFQTSLKEDELILEKELSENNERGLSFLNPLIRFNLYDKYHPSFSSRIAAMEAFKQDAHSPGSRMSVPRPI